MSASSVPAGARILLVTGGAYHDFDAGAKQLTEALHASGRFSVTHVRRGDRSVPEFAGLTEGSFAAVLLYTQGGELTVEQEKGLTRFVENGGGLVGIHCAADSFTGNPGFARLLGCKFAQHPPGTFGFRVTLSPSARDAGHLVVARCNDFDIEDEHYVLQRTGEDGQVLATSHYAGRQEPMVLTRRQGKGTVVYLANGHDTTALGNPYFQRLLERSLRLACGEAPANNTIRAGIIGYGGAFNMGKHHASCIDAQLGMKTVAVCDLDPKRTEQAKVELGQSIRTYNDMDRLLADDGVDLVVVILPHHLHARACIAASKAGKHVVTEKPFCITIEEADAMLAAAQEAGRMLSCFHNRRWDGDFRAMLQAVRSGQIGQVYHADAATAGYHMPGSWWRSSKEMSGGVLYDWGAHYCDWLLNFIPRRVESVSGVLQKRHWHQSTNEDYALAVVRFEGGFSATLEQGTLAAIPRQGWRILGTLGALSNAGPGRDITLVRHVAGVRQEAQVKPGEGMGINYYQNVANHLLLGERLVVTAAQARRAISVLRLAELSHQRGGAPLPLPGEADYTPDYVTPL